MTQKDYYRLHIAMHMLGVILPMYHFEKPPTGHHSAVDGALFLADTLMNSSGIQFDEHEDF